VLWCGCWTVVAAWSVVAGLLFWRELPTSINVHSDENKDTSDITSQLLRGIQKQSDVFPQPLVITLKKSGKAVVTVKETVTSDMCSCCSGVRFYFYFLHSMRVFLRNKTLFMCIAWANIWFLFVILWSIAKVVVEASDTDVNNNTILNLASLGYPTWSLFREIVVDIFSADNWAQTLAEFLGADVILTDLVFGAMTAAKWCTTGCHPCRAGRHSRMEQKRKPWSSLERNRPRSQSWEGMVEVTM